MKKHQPKPIHKLGKHLKLTTLKLANTTIADLFKQEQNHLTIIL